MKARKSPPVGKNGSFSGQEHEWHGLAPWLKQELPDLKGLKSLPSAEIGHAAGQVPVGNL